MSEYLEAYAQQFAAGLVSNSAIKAFADNSDVIGAYAESTVRELIRRMVAPLRVSRGTVISGDSFQCPKSVPELDTIIWDPNPLPAIFESGDFGLIPQKSCCGILEIKRSVYNREIGSTISGSIEKATSLIGCGDAGLKKPLALGVVCLQLEEQRQDSVLKQLVKEEKAVILIRMENGEPKAIKRGVCVLINYLQAVRWRARFAHAKGFLNPDSWAAETAEGTGGK